MLTVNIIVTINVNLTEQLTTLRGLTQVTQIRNTRKLSRITFNRYAAC